MTTLEPIVAHYARIAADPDPVIRNGWSSYLKARLEYLDKQFPGIKAQVDERAKLMLKEATC